MRASARARELVEIAASAAADKLATDVQAFDVGDQLAITDAFVIASAPTERQVQAIAEEIEDRLARDAGAQVLRREGVAEGRWVLLDVGEVVIHVMHGEDRAYYQLERLWKDCPAIDLSDVLASAGPSTVRSSEAPAGTPASDAGSADDPRFGDRGPHLTTAVGEVTR